MQVDELREELREVAARAPGSGADARAFVLQRGRKLVRRKRYTQASMTLVIAAVVVASVIAVQGGSKDGSGKTVLTTPPTTTPASFAQDTGIEELADPPLSRRYGEALVWTGSNLVAWGGRLEAANVGLPGPDREFNDGSIFSLATRTWTPMAPSPLPATVDQTVGTPTDDGVVFARGREAALWNERANSWRKLDDAPRAVSDLTYTGSEVLSYSANATLDLRTGKWETLPEPPSRFERPTQVWTGRELVVVGGPGTPFTSAAAIALDPAAREWRRIANPPADLHAEALSASWDGRRVVVVNYDMRAVTYDPQANTWTTIAAVPARFSEWSPVTQSVGGYTVAFMSQAVVVLTPDGTWIPLPYGNIPFGSIATTRPGFSTQAGNGLLFIRGTRNLYAEGTEVLTALDLAQLVEAPPRLQVGIGSIALAADYHVRASHYDVRSEVVTVELAGPNNVACAIQSHYAVPFAPVTPKSAPIADSLDTDGRATTWHRNAESTVWRYSPGEVGSTDTFTVSCPGAAATAGALATSASFK